MKSKTVFLVVFVAFLLTAGCISSTKTTTKKAPTVFIKPCNVAPMEVQVRVKAEKLDNLPATAKVIKPELELVFVDNFKSPAAATMEKSYDLSCHWGDYVGERRDYYYCDGSYKAPEIDENQVIKRFIEKEFSIGFAVEEHNIGKWTDSSGQVHDEGSIYYLTVKSVDTSCYVATD